MPNDTPRASSTSTEDLDQLLHEIAAAHPRVEEVRIIDGHAETRDLLQRVRDAWTHGKPILDVVDDDAPELRVNAALLMAHYLADPVLD